MKKKLSNLKLRTKKLGAIAVLFLLLSITITVVATNNVVKMPTSSNPGSILGLDLICVSNGNTYLPTVANIQIAIDDAHSNTTGNMGTVQIPSGTYTITSELTVYSNITIIGGGFNTIFQRGFDGTLIDENSVENVIVKDLKFDGNGYNQIMLIFRTGCSQIHFENVYLFNAGQSSNTWDWGISFYGANFSSFSGTADGFSTCICLTNQAEYCSVDAIIKPADYIDDSYQGLIVQGNYNKADVVVYHSGYRGIYLNGNYNKIDAVINETGDYGFFQQNGEGNIVTATIRNAGTLTPNAGGGAGIRQGQYNQYQFNIEGSYYDGLSVGSHIGAGESCCRNTFIIDTKNNNQNGGTSAGLKLYTGTEATANVSDNVFYGGTLGDNQGSATQYCGIYITGSGIENNNTFYGFDIFGNTDGGIITGGDDNSFIDLNIHGNGGSAVTLAGPGNHTFSRCKGYDNSTLFPFYEQTTAPTIADNCTAYWYDTDDSYMYQIVQTYGTTYYMNMTTTI